MNPTSRRFFTPRSVVEKAAADVGVAEGAFVGEGECAAVGWSEGLDGKVGSDVGVVVGIDVEAGVGSGMRDGVGAPGVACSVGVSDGETPAQAASGMVSVNRQIKAMAATRAFLISDLLWNNR
jgi:hypothetical protein